MMLLPSVDVRFGTILRFTARIN